jgi:hypothetical protein
MQETVWKYRQNRYAIAAGGLRDFRKGVCECLREVFQRVADAADG